MLGLSPLKYSLVNGLPRNALVPTSVKLLPKVIFFKLAEVPL